MPVWYPIEFLENFEAEMDSAARERLVEICLTVHVVKFAAAIKAGRVLPRKVSPDLYMPRKTIDGENGLRAWVHFLNIQSFGNA